jgi:hypothetical protein
MDHVAESIHQSSFVPTYNRDHAVIEVEYVYQCSCGLESRMVYTVTQDWFYNYSYSYANQNPNQRSYRCNAGLTQHGLDIASRFGDNYWARIRGLRHLVSRRLI